MGVLHEALPLEEVRGDQGAQPSTPNAPTLHHRRPGQENRQRHYHSPHPCTGQQHHNNHRRQHHRVLHGHGLPRLGHVPQHKGMITTTLMETPKRERRTSGDVGHESRIM